MIHLINLLHKLPLEVKSIAGHEFTWYGIDTKLAVYHSTSTISLHSMPHQQLSLLQDQLNNGLPLFVDLLKHTEKTKLLTNGQLFFS